MSGTVTIHVHAGYRQVHLLLGVAAIAADPPYPPGQVVTAGELTLPDTGFDPELLAARFPRAAWEAWWDTASRTPGRYAAFHPQRGPLQGTHTNRWLDHPLTRGWAWAVEGEQVAEVRATFSAAAAAARNDVVAAALAAQDPDHRFAHLQELAAARARAGGIVVTDGPWVLTWDGGRGYTLETLDDGGQALSVMDQVPYAVDDPRPWLVYPWADAHDWAPPPTNANPRLGPWLAAATLVRAEATRPVPLGPAASLGLVRGRTDPDPGVDRALAAAWAAAVSTQLPGCRLVSHLTGPQQWANDADQAVLLGPAGTDLDRVRAAGGTAAQALGWTGPPALHAARELPAPALAAAAAVVRAGIAHQGAAAAAAAEVRSAILAEAARGVSAEAARRGIGTELPGQPGNPAGVDLFGGRLDAVRHAQQHRVDTWRAATGHGFTAAQVAALDARVTGEQVTAALTGGPPGRRRRSTSALDPIRGALDQMAADGILTTTTRSTTPRRATAPPATGSAGRAPTPPPTRGHGGVSR